MSFAENIKKLRLSAILTQGKFSKELWVSLTTVNRWETGKTKTTIKAMKLIEEYCKKNNIAFNVAEKISGS